jgi:hypothetical protein
MATTNTKSPMTGLEASVARLLTDAREVRVAAGTARLSSGADEERYAEEVARLLSELETDLVFARAALDLRRSGDLPSVGDSLESAVGAAQQWLDDAAVQRHLARMEARDRADELTRRVEHVISEVRSLASRSVDGVGADVEQVRSAGLDALRLLGDAVGQAANAVKRLAVGDER